MERGSVHRPEACQKTIWAKICNYVILTNSAPEATVGQLVNAPALPGESLRAATRALGQGRQTVRSVRQDPCHAAPALGHSHDSNHRGKSPQELSAIVQERSPDWHCCSVNILSLRPIGLWYKIRKNRSLFIEFPAWRSDKPKTARSFM